MKVRVGNPFTTKMTKNNILNKELSVRPLRHHVVNGTETAVQFVVDGVEVDVRFSEEDLDKMLTFLRECKAERTA